MNNLPGSRLIRLVLLTLPLTLTLVWMQAGEANPSSLQQATGSSLTVTEAGAKNAAAVAGADIPLSMSPGSGTGGAAVDDGGKDLTVFFSIGVAVDILLVAFFVVWAIGQWSKTKQ